MEENPYESPQLDVNPTSFTSSWQQGYIGLLFSLAALTSLLLVGWSGPKISLVASLLTFLSIPSLLICIVERIFAVQKRLSTWGIFISLFVMAYLPTMSIGLRSAFRRWAEH